MNFGDLLGTTGGNSGANFQPANVNLTAPAKQGQADTAYQNVQDALAQQQSFVNALGLQGGLTNQASALSQQQNLANQLANAHGIQNQTNTFAQQQALAQQLQNIAAGQGPNPAQAQLAQATGANVANQAALQGNQRGVGSNIGLAERQIAQQGAATQQQAAGQAATLQAQQSLAALGQVGAQQQSMQQVAANQVAQQQAQQQAIQQAATQQVTQQTAGIGNLNTLNQSEQGQLLGSLGQFNNAQVGMQENINNIQGQLQNTLESGQNSIIGGLLKGGGNSAQVVGAAHGGMIPSYSRGGQIGYAGGGSVPLLSANDPNIPSSFAGKYFQGFQDVQNQESPNFGSGFNQDLYNGASNVRSGIGRLFASGPATMGDAGSGYTNAGAGSSLGQQMTLSKGGEVLRKSGGKVPGKAKVPGDSFANDTVNTKLSPEEIVIPRSITMGKNPIFESARLVAAILAQNKGMRYA